MHAAVKPASDAELDAFLNAWPDIDPMTGLNLKGDELIIKAREAMIAAVHTFNSAGLFFRAEMFIVTSVIAWTYLMHAYYKRESVDYRYKKAGVVQKTKHGADKYWELGQCLSHGGWPPIGCNLKARYQPFWKGRAKRWLLRKTRLLLASNYIPNQPNNF